MYTVIWGIYIKYSRNAVGHSCAMSQAYLVRGILCNVCIAVLLVTLLIALSSYEVKIYPDIVVSKVYRN